jgi:hypothetical protein
MDFLLRPHHFSFIMVYRSRKLRLTTVGDPPHLPRDTRLSTKVGTKFCQ